MTILNYFVENYIVLISILGMVFTLIVYPLKNKRIQVTMFVALGIILALTFAVYFDYYLSKNVFTYTPYRVIASYFNYTFKVSSIGCLLLVFKSKKKDWIVVLSAMAINHLVYMLMFFTKWVVWFNELNEFQIGPLRSFFVLPSVLFLFLLLEEFWAKRRIGRAKEAIFVFFIASIMIVSVAIELFTEITEYTPFSIVFACIFYFIEIYASNEQNDPVTGLFNRNAFSRETSKNTHRIKCVISTDLNYLKLINDTKGHEEGDAALKAVGESLILIGEKYSERHKRTFVSFRVGGDEMTVLLFGKFNKENDTEIIESFIKDLKEEVKNRGYSVACGYAVNDITMSFDEILNLADKKMYLDKSDMKSI